jgi:hypothetical protein
MLLALSSSACTEVSEPGEPFPRDGAFASPLRLQRVPAPLPAAHCAIQVDGTGLVDMETDYLPHVITCENGGANLEALKAQAIAARSVAYYAIETSGSICDGQGCQVYSCAADPSDLAYQAVMETSGLYLMSNSTLTYGFYVAGDNATAPPACVGVSGSTEGWVTYNEGRTGTDVIQTELGFVHQPGDSGYGQNRGCMSQWGGRCLENDNGYDFRGILKFYYGDDIGVQQAQGECVSEVDPSDGSSGGDVSGGLDSIGSEGPGSTSFGPGTGDETGIGDPGDGPGGSDPTTPPSGSGEVGTGGGALGPGSALPDTYGGSNVGNGCACGSGRGSLAWAFVIFGLVLGSRRRR